MKTFPALILLLQLSSAATIPRSKPLTDLHFPSSQLSTTSSFASPVSHQEEQENLIAFDDSPMTLPSIEPTAHVLAASTPLESSYLQSLANPATHPPSSDPLAKPETNEMASKSDPAVPAGPSGALPVLRKEEEEQYWATQVGIGREHQSTPSNHILADAAQASSAAVSFSSSIMRAVRICPEQIGITRKLSGGGPLMVAREYSDVLVVGVVLIFLVVVVVLEARQKFSAVTPIRSHMRGKIYLSDDDEALYILRKGRLLHPAPKIRYYSRFAKRRSMYDADSGSDTAVEDTLFEDDEHRYEKV